MKAQSDASARSGQQASSDSNAHSDPKAHGLAVGFGVDQDVYSCLGAHNVVKRYRSAGAAGGQPFLDQLAAWKKRLDM